MSHNAVPETVQTPNGPLTLLVADRRIECGDVAVLDLVRPDGGDLPPWAPGAHISLRLGADDRVREYSLCGSPLDRTRWTIAVRRAEGGRGGSEFVHRELVEGAEVEAMRIGNLFPYAPSERARFLAAGIGVTPILPMIEAAERDGADWSLLYVGRDRAALPFLDVLQSYGDRVRIVETAVEGRPDIGAFVAQNEGADIFCCGPEQLLDDIEVAARAAPGARVSVERFSPRTPTGHVPDTGFEIVVESTGRSVLVRSDQTALCALLDAGVRVMNSCGEGTCGSCETPVLEGIPDHRDSILSDEEREAGEYMYVCVSRSVTPTLRLDL